MLATSSSSTITRNTGFGIVPADVAGDALPGHPADPRADLLDRRHQREGEQHDPAHREAERAPTWE